MWINGCNAGRHRKHGLDRVAALGEDRPPVLEGVRVRSGNNAAAVSC
jgi:hypothetical protein